MACEESQAVTTALRARGVDAYSCDTQEPSGGHPEWHILGDVLSVLNPSYKFRKNGGFVPFIRFRTMDGQSHSFYGRWDLVIAFPPCTYLTAAGAVRLFNSDGSIKDPDRYEKGKRAAEFFQMFLHADCEHIVVENPVPLKCFGLPTYSQIIEPYFFGDPWKKRTCLWLVNLPALRPTNMVEPQGLWVGSTSQVRDPTVKYRYALSSNRDPKIRSKTFPGVAEALADQLVPFCLAHNTAGGIA